MGNEFAQTREWNHDVALDWPLLQWPLHRGVQDLVKDLNRLYRCRASLHLDCENEGFDWIDCHDNDASVISFRRRARRSTAFTIAVCNFTPVVREAYRIGAPKPGRYNELLNTDSTFYGGSNVGNWGGLQTEAQPMHGFAQSLRLTLPPLATLLLSFEEPAET
jgi:1,4-alpha-glucan branching enzyme